MVIRGGAIATVISHRLGEQPPSFPVDPKSQVVLVVVAVVEDSARIVAVPHPLVVAAPPKNTGFEADHDRIGAWRTQPIIPTAAQDHGLLVSVVHALRTR